MEEVDKIIIQSLTSVGCELTPDIRSISQFSQENFVEAVVKLLNTINPGSDLPAKLPPNTGVKFRICTKFANICQQLGYKNEIGYQTFLYLNELDMRRLLMFLVERLSKELSSSADQTSQLSADKPKNLNSLIAQRVKSQLSQFWMPPYCKLNGLRIHEDDSFTKEGCKFVRDFKAVDLSIPYLQADQKSKYSDEIQSYFEKHCKYVTNQATRQAVDLLTSLMHLNASERVKEQSLFKQNTNSTDKIQELKSAIRDSLKKANELTDESSQGASVLTNSDISEIEAALELSPKQMNNKASRFTHSEKLQFTMENEKDVVISSSNEEQKEEEIKSLKESLEDLNQSYQDLCQEIKRLNGSIAQIDQACSNQVEVNNKLQESVNVKEKTVKLVQDAPKNILRLKEEINNHDDKMSGLEEQWTNHKRPLETERKQLKQMLDDKKALMQEKLEETKQIRLEIDSLNTELSGKEEIIAELKKDLESNEKNANKNTNRQFYTKRILEIMANIDKQKKEINKVLIETRNIQKEINQLIGKLERAFNTTDELIFKDAKKDEANKKVYKLFISINDSYEQLIQTIEESSHFERDNRDLEDQVNSESENKVVSNMEMVLKDYKQIKEENEALVKSLKG